MRVRRKCRTLVPIFSSLSGPCRKSQPGFWQTIVSSKLSWTKNFVYPHEMDSPMKRILTVQLVLAVLIILSSVESGLAQFSGGAPKPGEVYKEFTFNNGGNNWRVTAPDTDLTLHPEAASFLPNPVLHLWVDDLQYATKAELVIDFWGGHEGTTSKKIRVNSNNWIPIPELDELGSSPAPGEEYMQQVNHLIQIPLSQLKTGDNTLEGTCGLNSWLWGQWGWYGAILRVYYNPQLKAHATGRITSPASNSMFSDNPTIQVSTSGNVTRVDYLAYYEGYDSDGDGVYLDWQRNYHRTPWNDSIGIKGHVGTATNSPFSVLWDTRWVPDQDAGQVKLIARIRDAGGVWYVTDEVANLSFQRTQSVQLYKAVDVPEIFWVRGGQTKSCKVYIPTLANATEAVLLVKTWDGNQTGQSFYTKVNDYTTPKYGLESLYSYDTVSIPLSALTAGDNTITFHSDTDGHGIEVMWPGPALQVRYGQAPSGTAPAISQHPQSKTVLVGRTGTFSVSATGTAPLSYQWKKNGANISGANSSSYTVPAVTIQDSGSTFCCVVSNSVGSVTSENATLTVTETGTAPGITEQPKNQTVLVGDSTSFSVTASGTGPFSYQWKKNGSEIAGATGSSYTTPPVCLSDNGAIFTCVVTNDYGTVPSQGAVLVVSTTPVPTSQNVLSNPDFDGSTGYWTFYTSGQGSFTITSPGYDGSAGAACITTQTGGTNIQLFQNGITLEPNTEYELSFAAYSNTGHDVTVSLSMHTSPYTNYGLSNFRCDLSTSWKIFKTSFRTANFSATVNDARLMFWFADTAVAGDKFWIDKIVLAKKVASTVRYTLSTSVTGLGGIALDPAGGVYEANTTVRITAEPAPGWQFGTWSGGLSGSAPYAELTITGDTSIGAEFVQDLYTLDISTVGQGTVGIDPDKAAYGYGELVTLTPNPASGWTFAGWDGNINSLYNWWDSKWGCRTLVTVDVAEYERIDKPVEQKIDFTQMLRTLHKEGPLDLNSLRVVEIDSSGKVIDSGVPFQFDRDSNFEATSNASGTLVFILKGATAADAVRYYHVYFDTVGAGFEQAQVGQQVSLLDNQMDEGQASYRIQNANAVFYFQKAAGGFSSLLDMNGNDWLSYAPTGGAAGNYRGIPNMVFPESQFHPGSTAAVSSIVNTGPIKTTIHTATIDGKWEALWEFYPRYATMTLLRAGHTYWFLYEGTPGGVLDSADYMVRSDGAKIWAMSSWAADLAGIAGEEWIYFTDPNTNGKARSLFLVHHENDGGIDSYYAMNGAMTVFGFGRSSDVSYLTQVPAHFSVGLMDETEFGPASKVIRSAGKGLNVALGNPQINTAGPTTLVMTEDKFLTAIFVYGRLCGVSVQTVGSGSVSLNPPGGTYSEGTTVELTAVPAAGWRFSGWSGSLSGSTNPASLVVDGDEAITATFTQLPTYSLSVQSVGSGTVTFTPSGGSYLAGTVVNVTATPSSGWKFSGWSGSAGGNENPLALTMDANKTLTAVFTQIGTYALSVQSVGSGTVTLDPPGGVYLSGTVVQVTASPANGWYFSGWSGARTGTANPLSITVDGDKSLTATFLQTTHYNLSVQTVGSGSVILDPPGGSYASGTTVHLTATPASGWRFSHWSGSLGGTDGLAVLNMDSNKSVTATFTESTTIKELVSDDFDTCGLRTDIWTFINPLGDGNYLVEGVGTGNSRLQLSVPAGRSHDPWNTNPSVRMMQATDDLDFEVEIKFDSQPTLQYQNQGIIVEQDAGNWLRFEFYYDGNSLKVFSASTENGLSSMRIGKAIAAGSPLYLRVKREGDLWTQSYSYNGTTWTVAGSYMQALTVHAAGPFASNHGTNGNMPAFTAIVDYFFNTLYPISPEDGAVSGSMPNQTLTVSVVGQGTVSKNPNQTEFPCGTVVQLTAMPASGWSFSGWSGSASGSSNPLTLGMDADKNVTATFVQVPPSLTSDDFNTCGLNTDTWTFINPLGDGSYQIEGAGTGDAHLLLTVPAGKSHDPWNTNPSVRMMQAAEESDFEIEVKFDSQPTQKYQNQGIIVEQDTNNWLRFDFVHDGSNLNIFAASTTSGVTTTRINKAITAGTPLYLRVKKTGFLWTESYSYNGTSWTSSGSFTQALTVRQAGPFVSNFGLNGVIPAFTARIDYFFNTSSPIVPEDGTAPRESLNLSVEGSGTIRASPDQESYSCGEFVVLTATPSTGWLFSSWSGAASGNINPLAISMDGNKNITAVFAELPSYSLSVQVVGSGSVTSDPPGGTYPSGTEVILTATPAEGWQFIGWSGAAGGYSETASVTMNADKSVTATFTRMPTYNLAVQVLGSGSVTLNPAGGSYLPGTQVQLTAIPYSGWNLTGWSGDASGNAVSTIVTMNSGKSVTAAFALIPFYNLAVQTEGSGTVVLDPPGGSYPDGTVVHVSAIPYHGWEFALWSGAAAGSANPASVTMNANKSLAAQFSKADPSTVSIASDDFNTCGLRNDLWTFVDPLGDASYMVEGVGSGDAHLRLCVPAGTSHNPWDSNHAVRVMQTAGDTDFEIEVKFDSVPSRQYQMQGILVEQDESNWIRFDFFHDGTKLTVFAASTSNGSSASRISSQISAGSSLYMRVKREGDLWSQSYSTNGTDWTQAGSFMQSLAVSAVGLFAGNYGVNGNASAYTAMVDYFFSTSEPVFPEDGALPEAIPEKTLNISIEGDGTVTSNPDGTAFACGTVIQVAATPAYGWYFAGWTGAAHGTANPLTIGMDGDKDLHAVFSQLPEACVSDDFNTCGLRSDLWTFVNPLGDGSYMVEGVGTGDAHLRLSVPAGVSHNAWNTNDTVRMMQPSTNADFEIEVKFDSQPTEQYQLQGVLVEQDEDDWLRFEFHYDGAGMNVFAASTAGGLTSTRIMKRISAGSTLYLRITREGDLWTESYSYNGVGWLEAGSFSQSLNVSAMGPFAGNFSVGGMVPGFTVIIDYFFNAHNPIVTQDTVVADPLPERELNVSVTGEGTVAASPDQTNFTCGRMVELNAIPQSGWRFSGWNGDAVGSTNPLTVGMDADKNITAAFAQIPTYTISTQTAGAGTVALDPSGGTYLEGTIVRISASPADGWRFVSWSGAVIGTDNPLNITVNGNKSIAAKFIPIIPNVSGIISDDFNRNNLDTQLWTLVDPLGDSSIMLTGSGTGNAQLRFSVPAGVSHNAWVPNTAPRLLQQIENTDFELQVKFSSSVTQKCQSQGIIVQEDDSNWLRFDFFSDVSGVRAFAADVVNGVPNTLAYQLLMVQPVYMQVTRTGDTWDFRYSADGVEWKSVVSFVHTMVTCAIGPFVGNYSDSGKTAPAHSAIIDYFMNMKDPIIPEDGIPVADALPPFLQQLKTVAGDTSIRVAWLTDESAIGSVDYSSDADPFPKVVVEPEPSWLHNVLIPNLLPDTLYSLQVNSEDSFGNAASFPAYNVRTLHQGVGQPVITFWYGSEQKFGEAGLPQRWINIVGNVSGTSSAVTSLTYSLNDGLERALTIGPTSTRLTQPGDFNIEIGIDELQGGENMLQVKAVNEAGLEKTEIVTINFTKGNTIPENYSIDWSKVGSIQDVAQVVDGHWVLENGGIRSIAPGYDRLVAIGDMSWRQYEATVPVTINAIVENYDPPGGGPFLGLISHWQGHTADGNQPSVQWWPLGTCAGYVWQKASTKYEMVDYSYQVYGTGTPLQVGGKYFMKIRSEIIGDGILYRMKVWPQDQTEPSSWNLERTEAVAADQKSGSLLLVSQFLDVTFGNVNVVPVQ